jgi:sec-independent protein translocase protein TatB
MFDFGGRYTELLVLVVVAIIVIGPKDLPVVLRKFGQFMNKMRSMAREFQGHVDVAMKDAGMDGIKKDLQDLSSGISGAISTPQIANTSTFVEPSTSAAPTMPQLAPVSSPSSLPSSSSDFATYFGTARAAGETWVAGTRVGPEAPPAP